MFKNTTGKMEEGYNLRAPYTHRNKTCVEIDRASLLVDEELLRSLLRSQIEMALKLYKAILRHARRIVIVAHNESYSSCSCCWTLPRPGEGRTTLCYRPRFDNKLRKYAYIYIYIYISICIYIYRYMRKSQRTYSRCTYIRTSMSITSKWELKRVPTRDFKGTVIV